MRRAADELRMGAHRRLSTSKEASSQYEQKIECLRLWQNEAKNSIFSVAREHGLANISIRATDQSGSLRENGPRYRRANREDTASSAARAMRGTMSR